MDALFHGKAYEQMDDLGGFPIIVGNTHSNGCQNPNEPRKKPSYFPLYWLLNRDPYNSL